MNHCIHMVFDYYIFTAIDEYNIHFDIHYRKNDKFGHTKEGYFLTAFQSMTFYGTYSTEVVLRIHESRILQKLILKRN